MSDDLSCPNCESKSITRKRYLAIPRMKKFKMDFCTPKCVGKNASMATCPRCGVRDQTVVNYEANANTHGQALLR
ncbi:uncharacterized protein [Drosophila suzukii]